MATFECGECKKKFKEKKSLDLHMEDKHVNPRHEHVATKKVDRNETFTIKGWLIIIGVFIGIVALIVWLITVSSGSNVSLDIQVDKSEIPTQAIHWHPHLTITVDSKNVRLPADLGLTGGHYPLHTHDESGEVHMENENPQLVPEAMYLGGLFEQWGKVLNESCIFDSCTNSGELHMYVNGKENFDFQNYLMQDGDQIVIEYTSNK